LATTGGCIYVSISFCTGNGKNNGKHRTKLKGDSDMVGDKYDYIYGSLRDVKKRVDKALKDGWQPQGGLSFSPNGSCVQAIVKPQKLELH
jgi:hypothetical protein